jgi:hypothetical protein
MTRSAPQAALRSGPGADVGQAARLFPMRQWEPSGGSPRDPPNYVSRSTISRLATSKEDCLSAHENREIEGHNVPLRARSVSR